MSLKEHRSLCLTCRDTCWKLVYSLERRFFNTLSVYFTKSGFQRLIDISSTDHGKFMKAITIELQENRSITSTGQNKVLKEGMFVMTVLHLTKDGEAFYYSEHITLLSKQAVDRYSPLISEKNEVVVNILHTSLLTKPSQAPPNSMLLKVSDSGMHHKHRSALPFTDRVSLHSHPFYLHTNLSLRISQSKTRPGTPSASTLRQPEEPLLNPLSLQSVTKRES